MKDIYTLFVIELFVLWVFKGMLGASYKKRSSSNATLPTRR